MKNENLKEIEKTIIPILKRNGVVRAGIFGSFVRGEARKKSDIDILIKFKGRKSLLDLVGLKLELEEKLGKKVDIVEYSAIHPLIRDKVLKEQVRVL
jgi:predicted nucleotidyltransferase